MANSKMITGNQIQKIIQLTSMFNESLWSCSHKKIRLIHQFALAIQALKHQESELCTFLVISN